MKGTTEKELRDAIVEVGRMLYDRGFVAAGDGNISARLADGTLLATPTMVCKGRMTPDMIVHCNADGAALPGQGKPSSELAMHLEIYRLRPDIQAVVHAHPPTATGFAVAGLALDRALLSEVVLTLGCIPLTEYGTPSTNEIVDALSPFIPAHDALLLANHGAVAYGPNMEAALSNMETLEHFAKISLVAHLLGGARQLPARAVEKLIEVREKAGYMGSAPRAGQACSFTPQTVEQTAFRSGSEETITLTRSELIRLIEQSTRALNGSGAASTR
ncbi:MAG TPA: class II aldolase/adducin family protein [Blastocatellia bacterium]|nr:class II aldolase/adducin family protein [Blastocatellia bacterium]